MQDMHETQAHFSESHSMTSLEELAAIESHIRLQRSQEEFLNWLSSNEQSHTVDRYIYRKIR